MRLLLPTGTLHQVLHVGLRAGDHWRLVAQFSATDWDDIIMQGPPITPWLIAGNAPTAGQVAQARMLGRGARVAGGMPAVAPPPVVNPPLIAPPAATRPMIALNQIICQADEAKVELLDQPELDKCLRTYNNHFGKDPEDYEEATPEQLIATKHYIADLDSINLPDLSKFESQMKENELASDLVNSQTGEPI